MVYQPLKPRGVRTSFNSNARRPSPGQKVRKSSLFIATQLFKQFPNNIKFASAATVFMGIVVDIVIVIAFVVAVAAAMRKNKTRVCFLVSVCILNQNYYGNVL